MKFPAFHGTQRFIIIFTRDPILSQMKLMINLDLSLIACMF